MRDGDVALLHEGDDGGRAVVEALLLGDAQELRLDVLERLRERLAHVVLLEGLGFHEVRVHRLGRELSGAIAAVPIIDSKEGAARRARQLQAPVPPVLLLWPAALQRAGTVGVAAFRDCSAGRARE